MRQIVRKAMSWWSGLSKESLSTPAGLGKVRANGTSPRALRMPQIIKTVGEASLTGSSVPLWFTDLKHAPDRVPGYADYYALADDGIVYVIYNDSSDPPGWKSYRWLPDDSVQERENIWRMLSKGRMAGDVSRPFKTKKALVEAIEAGTTGETPWQKLPSFAERWAGSVEYHRNKPAKPARQVDLEAQGPLGDAEKAAAPPKWVWYLAAAVVVAVAIALLSN